MAEAEYRNFYANLLATESYIESLIVAFSNLLKIDPNLEPLMTKIKEILQQCREDIQNNVTDFRSSIILIETKVLNDSANITKTLNFDQSFSTNYKTKNFDIISDVRHYNFGSIDNSEDSNKNSSNGEISDLNENSNSSKNPAIEKNKVKIEEIKVECSDNFSNHVDITPEESKIDNRLPQVEQTSSSEDLENKQFSCDKCNKVFSCKLALSNHIKKEGYETKLLADKDKNFKCVVCYCLFRTEDALRKHKDTFIHEKSTCDQCGKSFSHKKKYERHKKSHTTEKPFSCDLCGVTFKWKHSVRLHKTTVHEEKPISCEVCGKVLKNERYLKDHMIGHSAGKRFSCELCGKTFRWPNGLLKHKKFHSDVMPFSCNVCDKSFKEKATLQNHKIIHNKNLYFKCEICARTFSFQSALNRHCIRVHKFKKESLIKSKLKEM